MTKKIENIHFQRGLKFMVNYALLGSDCYLLLLLLEIAHFQWKEIISRKQYNRRGKWSVPMQRKDSWFQIKVQTYFRLYKKYFLKERILWLVAKVDQEDIINDMFCELRLYSASLWLVNCETEHWILNKSIKN